MIFKKNLLLITMTQNPNQQELLELIILDELTNTENTVEEDTKEDTKERYVYKIFHNEEAYIYIGSTKLNINQRFELHKSNYKQFINGKSNYCTIYYLFDFYDMDDCEIEILETIIDPTVNIREVERKYIEENKDIVLNKVSAFTTENEARIKLNAHIREKYKTDENFRLVKQRYFEKYKDFYIQYKKDYYIKNKERLDEYQKEHYIKNRDTIQARHKAYRELPENVLKNRKYQSDRHIRLKESGELYVKCVCDGSYTTNQKHRHLRTQLHQNYVKNIPKKELTGDRIMCECGDLVSKSNISRHQKSKTHLKKLNV